MVTHQLAVLIGKAPAEADIRPISLADLHLPQELPLSLPSTIVRQRPDLRAAEALMHPGQCQCRSCYREPISADYLVASGGGIGSSFTNGGPVWSFGGALAQPVFNGGSLRAEQRKAVAAYEEAGANSQQVLLQAFEQVADSLRAIERDANTLQARTAAATQAETTYKIASQRYSAGGISQLSLLDAQRQYLQTQLDRTTSVANRYSDSTSLFQALGGGWWNEKQP